MANSKPEQFTKEELELADIFKSLSHPARIKILKILSSMDVCVCGEIVDILPLAQATVSQHLKELKRVDLIKGEIEGPKTCYCINTSKVQKAYDGIQKLFNDINKECKKSCRAKTK
jgi:ArsR family transcriptional regulator, arsenate/arsenite/antimonite-responsive transcriptional repressor